MRQLMRQLIKTIKCHFNGHDYHWHFADSPHNTRYFQCRKCHKIKWDPKDG